MEKWCPEKGADRDIVEYLFLEFGLDAFRKRAVDRTIIDWIVRHADLEIEIEVHALDTNTTVIPIS